MYPLRSEGVQARKVGPDTLILHSLLKQYHVLNHVAGRIWDLADGTRGADEIGSIVAAEFAVDEATARADVVSTLEALAALRIVELEPAR
ncbi:MAG: PqqD family protein [Candidatus Eremiobacteraeota bacterium]|nr:PqqD family protein [Candidatus Eremiobacteraeota bacterium]